MNTLDRLKELERKADEANAAVNPNNDPRIPQWITVERAEFLYKLEKEWPKLRAIVEAASNEALEWNGRYCDRVQNDERLAAWKILRDAQAALEQE